MYNEIINLLPIPQRKVTLEDREKWVDIQKKILTKDFLEYVPAGSTQSITKSQLN